MAADWAVREAKALLESLPEIDDLESAGGAVYMIALEFERIRNEALHSAIITLQELLNGGGPK